MSDYNLDSPNANLRSERRFALPAQNDLHSVENFFTLDEETYFLYIYSPRTNEKFATSCSYIYFSHEPQWPRSFPPVVSLAPQCPRMAKRVPLRTRPRVIHVEGALLARSETPFPPPISICHCSYANNMSLGLRSFLTRSWLG